jgi:hypothetical protein
MGRGLGLKPCLMRLRPDVPATSGCATRAYFDVAVGVADDPPKLDATTNLAHHSISAWQVTKACLGDKSTAQNNGPKLNEIRRGTPSKFAPGLREPAEASAGADGAWRVTRQPNLEDR